MRVGIENRISCPAWVARIGLESTLAAAGARQAYPNHGHGNGSRWRVQNDCYSKLARASKSAESDCSPRRGSFAQSRLWLRLLPSNEARTQRPAGAAASE